ncbi:MAG TPA: N-acylglucosamine 2-epimerase, partial [Actinophytocola sp.]|nr:N-acylglucosamine 2-epimerase [Actinophytocola sp.]
EAGVVLGDPRWLDAAGAAAELVVSLHLVDGRLRRASRDDVVGSAGGVLEDYGCLAEGLLVLHAATGNPRWLEVATGLLDTALDHFAGDVPGAFHDTADDADALVWRPSDIGDNASPSGSSAIAGALLLGAALAGPDRADRYRSAAESAVARAGLLAARVPRFAGHWLSVAEALIRGPLQVALVGAPDDPRTEELRAAAITAAPGGSVVVIGPPHTSGVPLLADRPLVDGAPAAYVCRGYVCDRPVTSAAELTAALAR